MEFKINLSDICEDLYRGQQKRKGRQFLTKQTKEQKTNFLSKNIKYLNEIFKAMQIVEYVKYIKPEFNLEANGYEFSERSRTFLVELLDQYTDTNLLELRRGHLDMVSDRCIVWIVEGLYKVFMYNDVPENILNQLASIMSNWTEYPTRKRYGKMFQMTYDLEQLAARTYWPKWKSDLNGNDNCIWLDAMQEDLKLFISKWRFIYECMGEGRQVEINDMAEEAYPHMTPEQARYAELKFVLAEELNEVMSRDEKLKKFYDDLNKEVLHKKTGYYADKQDSLEYMKKLIYKRTDELEKTVFERYIKEIYTQPSEGMLSDGDFENMKSSEETLKEAIDGYQESIMPSDRLVLSDLDIEDIITKFNEVKLLIKQ